MSVRTGGGRDHNPARPYWLYHYFDEQGVLLYVGIARDPVKRISEHASNQWFTYLHSVEVGESRPTRAEAEAVERVAITTELPLFNRTHATGWQMLAAIKYVRTHGHDSTPYERRLCSFATGGRYDSARTTTEQCTSFALAYERGEVPAWKLAQEAAA